MLHLHCLCRPVACRSRDDRPIRTECPPSWTKQSFNGLLLSAIHFRTRLPSKDRPAFMPILVALKPPSLALKPPSLALKPPSLALKPPLLALKPPLPALQPAAVNPQPPPVVSGTSSRCIAYAVAQPTADLVSGSGSGGALRPWVAQHHQMIDRNTYAIALTKVGLALHAADLWENYASTPHSAAPLPKAAAPTGGTPGVVEQNRCPHTACYCPGMALSLFGPQPCLLSALTHFLWGTWAD